MTAALPTPEVAQRALLGLEIAQVVLKKNVFETQDIDLVEFTRRFFAVNESKEEIWINLPKKEKEEKKIEEKKTEGESHDTMMEFIDTHPLLDRQQEYTPRDQAEHLDSFAGAPDRT
jgi:hypothetical protein